MYKRYRLLKDLPNVKAGAIFEWNSTNSWAGGPYSGGRYSVWPMPSEKSCDIIFTPHDVQNNPTWFEEIVEKKPFVWTDELVKEIIYRHCIIPSEYFTNLQKMLDKYKASKQQTQSIPAGSGTANDVQNTANDNFKRWDDTDAFIASCKALNEISVREGASFKGLWSLTHVNQLQDELIKLGYSIQKNPTANDVLNPVQTIKMNEATEKFIKEFTDKVEEARKYISNALGISEDRMGVSPSKPLNSEWEIVEFQFKDPGFRINDLWRNDDGTFGQYKIDQEVLLESPIHSIKSVKRLTDNEVFSVGDEVEYRSAENFAWDASKVWDGKIKSIKPAYNKEQLDFEIDDNHLWNDGLYPHKYIQNIRHKSTPSQPQNNKERATVTEFYFECMGTNNQKEYVLSVSRTIEHEEYPSIKQAIEQVLNSDK